MQKKYDIAILGAGPGGYVAAIRAAQLGAKIVLIEKDQVGGVCLNKGCIPTKALIFSTSLLEKIKTASNFGIDINGSVSPNLKNIIGRKNNIVSQSIKGIEFLLKSNNIDLIKGHGKLISKDRILVTSEGLSDRHISASNIIIATGSKPLELRDVPFDGKNIISSNEALDETQIPKSILIVGAGFIGCEWAFLYRSLGSEVSIVELMPRVLPNQDEDISKLIQRELKKNKTNLYLKNKIKYTKKENDNIEVTLDDSQSLTVEKILVSVGRSYNTQNMGLEELKLKLAKDCQIEVNEYLQTNIPNIYAIGDVIGGKMLAHKASYDGILAVENILASNVAAGFSLRKVNYNYLPSVIFTQPEISSFGITEIEAKENNFNYKTCCFPYRASGKAMVMGETNGFIKIIADKETNKILGAHIIGSVATEIIHELVLAASNDLPLESVINTIHGHPTISEMIKESAEDFFDGAIHLAKDK